MSVARMSQQVGAHSDREIQRKSLGTASLIGISLQWGDLGILFVICIISSFLIRGENKDL